MNWYYTQGGQNYGPLSEADLDALVQTGTIPAATLVWQPGMADWLPWSEARRAAPAAPAPAPASGLRVAGASHTHTPPVMGDAGCSQCGGVFPSSQVSMLGGLAVCPACRVTLLQRTRGGGTAAIGARRFAGFWIRFAAAFIDGIILQVLNIGVGFANGMSFERIMPLDGRPHPSAAAFRVQLIMFVVAVAYDIVCTGKMGGTPGKRALGLRVVTEEGQPVSYGRATGRFFAKFISAMTCLIGYIIAGFDKEKRGLHDMICKTRVIKE